MFALRYPHKIVGYKTKATIYDMEMVVSTWPTAKVLDNPLSPRTERTAADRIPWRPKRHPNIRRVKSAENVMVMISHSSLFQMTLTPSVLGCFAFIWVQRTVSLLRVAIAQSMRSMGLAAPFNCAWRHHIVRYPFFVFLEKRQYASTSASNSFPCGRLGSATWH